MAHPDDSTVSTAASVSRRDFTRQGAVSLSALVAGASLLLPSAHSSEGTRKKIRIGIAGGRFGASFQWHEHPDCVVAAVSDLEPSRREHLKKTYHCDKEYPSLEEMVKDPDMDAIGVFTDGPLHFQHAMLALENGKHVISAVPAVMAHTVNEALDQAKNLRDQVKKTGLTYMMAETSYWQQKTITTRRLYEKGAMGDIVSCDSDYFHPGLKVLYGTADDPTWRYGVPPMFYPTHCTAHLLSITKERLVEVACHGWGNDDPILQKNAFDNNPFWNETAHFKTDRGHPFRVRLWWEAPVWSTESASWFGTKMTLTAAGEKWSPSEELGRDDAGFAYRKATKSNFEIPEWWKTDMLPEPLRHNSGHEGSHTFITHEFVEALVQGRPSVIDIDASLDYTIPGIIAHQSALKGGELLKIPVIS